MATTKSWPGGSANVTTSTYSIPATGNVNWGALSNFLIALADGAQSTTFQKYAIRKATTTPVTVVASTDCVVVVDLAVAGPSTVNLPAGVAKQVLYIVDGKGDAGTNNITVVPNGVQTIAGSANYVLSTARQTIMLAFDTSDSDWKIVGVSNPPGTNIGGFTASRAIVSNGSGVLTSATTTSTEIGYVNGVTSAIQTQLNNKLSNPLTTTGDVIYASNTATPAIAARLGVGSTNNVLVVAGGLPTWNTIANASITAAAAIALDKLAATTISRALVSDGSGFVSAATTTATEIGYVNGVTSAIQTQLNNKATNPLTTTGDIIYASNTATPATAARLGVGSASNVLVVAGGVPTWNTIANASITASAAIAVNKLAALTVSRAVVSDGSGFVSAATTTSTEIGYVNGVTSAIQTQLDAKASNPLTTTGDMIYASNTATPATASRLSIGSANQLMSSNGTVPTWSLLVNASVSASAAIALSKLAATTVSRALVSDGSGFVSAATTTSTEIGFVNGVTSAIQTQLNAKLSTSLTSAHIFVGSAGGAATDTAVTGVIALTNAGVTSFSGGSTGSGNVVLATTPTLITPVLGVATGTSIALSSTEVLDYYATSTTTIAAAALSQDTGGTISAASVAFSMVSRVGKIVWITLQCDFTINTGTSKLRVAFPFTPTSASRQVFNVPIISDTVAGLAQIDSSTSTVYFLVAATTANGNFAVGAHTVGLQIWYRCT